MFSLANIAVLIPAAGISSRMGRPKQLLPWKGSTLLGNCICMAQSITDTIVIVNGAYKEKIEAEVKKFKVETVHNLIWKEGLGNSIAFGVNHIVEKHKDIDGILIVLPDQPFVTTIYLKEMVERFSDYDNSILATQYNGMNHGVPVMFPKRYFGELKELTGEKGAKPILEKYKDHVVSITPEFKLKDIDTVDDYQDLLKN